MGPGFIYQDGNIRSIMNMHKIVNHFFMLCKENAEKGSRMLIEPKADEEVWLDLERLDALLKNISYYCKIMLEDNKGELKS